MEDSDFLLHVGSFDKRKDLITLVKAFKLLKDDKANEHLKLVLAGQKILNGNDRSVKRIGKLYFDKQLVKKYFDDRLFVRGQK